MGKIDNLSPYERPREKLVRNGVDSLSDSELLALIIGSGTKDCSALEIAQKMIVDSFGLYNLLNKNYHELITFSGIKTAKACNLLAVFELAKRYEFLSKNIGKNSSINSDYIYRKYGSKIANLEYEVLLIVVLSRKRNIIHEETLCKGTEKEVNFSSSDIIKAIIAHKGKSCYIMHNHPNGLLKPSPFDVALTLDLLKLSKKMNCIIIDHLIVTSQGYYSLREEKEKLAD